MIVERKRANLTQILGLWFRPGINRIDDPEKVEELKENSSFKEQIEIGNMSIISDKTTVELSAKELINIINRTESIKELDEITDERTSVLQAIEKRKKMITIERVLRLKPEKALHIIEKIINVDILADLKAQEKRSDVIQAIDARMSVLIKGK